MTSEFDYRGVVEGFYGPAYPEDERLDLIREMGRWGMNTYLYAPKDDPLQRERWRDPYPARALAHFRSWVECGHACGVQVGFALSPGLSIHYASADDVARLADKFRAFCELGCRFLSLALDDVPSTLQHADDQQAFPSLAHAHAHLAHAVRDAVGDETILWLVPTDYAGTGSSPYLETLGRELDPKIEVAWTGRTVVSPEISPAEAGERARALKRRLLVWDNVPVADGPMRPMLHLGPYAGRPPELIEHVSGFLLNPMEHPRASRMTLRTAADFLTAPGQYQPEAAWVRAAGEVGAGAATAFTLFARAHRLSPLAPHDRDRELEACFESLCSDKQVERDVLGELDRLVSERERAAQTLREGLEDRALARELDPWLDAHQHECHRMRIALDLLAVLASGAEGMELFLAFSRFEGRLTHVPTPGKASFGPRRVLYPQLHNHEDQAAAFGSDPALFVDRCLADAFVRHAEACAGRKLGVIRL
ncbi:MAG: hypothetical protein GY944_10455 [bacterium]|nr:hypothetical protein [bacterium]